jgi:hypothetical protein
VGLQGYSDQLRSSSQGLELVGAVASVVKYHKGDEIEKYGRGEGKRESVVHSLMGAAAAAGVLHRAAWRSWQMRILPLLRCSIQYW